MDCIVHGVTKSWTPLSDFHFMFLGHLYVNQIPKKFSWELEMVDIWTKGPMYLLNSQKNTLEKKKIRSLGTSLLYNI